MTRPDYSSREYFDDVGAIVDRAQDTGIFYHFERISLFMDIEHALRQFNMNPADFLALDDATFLHDFSGIVANMNRTTGLVENCFLPRSANQ